ncbi:MAG TPA: FAD-dependent tricarballylate dehydrogenase TcuA [Stellaceae bacterium]|nr:FAD-dependent tricarballylate dehydrogenase TcuA [Stellaceae bacterium]
MSQSVTTDVLVVGCGIAGLSAAVSALEAGAQVAILERAPKEERGGNTRWTESLLRMKSEAEVSDDFETHFMENAGHHLDPALVRETARDYSAWPAIVRTLGFTDPELIASFAAGAGPTLAWLKRFGVRFDFLPTYFITSSTPRMAPVGGGLALVEALAAAAEGHGGRILYETTARQLLRDSAGRILGIRSVDRSGRSHALHARSVVLASGGFEGNPELLTRYLGPQARYLRPVARGGYYNKGEGIQMALAAGAAPAGDYGAFHAEPIDPRSGATEPVVMVFNYGMLVNARGQRFTDEAPKTVDACYEAITRRIWEQPQGIAYVILDAGIADVPNWRRSVRSDQPPVEAPAISALAEGLGLDPGTLQATVADYNRACPDSAGFKPLALDGLATRGLDPPKSNWARPLDRPPFLAYPITCANCFTFGGVKVDTDARVLDLDGVPIDGLYAVGEVMGLYYGTYTGATSVLRGAVFGRKAGLHAARRAV